MRGRREGLSICFLRSLRGLTMSQERGLRESETQSSLHNERKVKPRDGVINCFDEYSNLETLYTIIELSVESGVWSLEA